MAKKIFIFMGMLLVLGGVLSFAQHGLAQSTYTCDPTADPTCLGYGGSTGLSNKDARAIIASIINVSLGLLGTIAIVIVVYAGFLWMTAGGEAEKTGEARKWMYAGAIGLAIILSAYGIATFVVNSLTTATK